MTGLWFYSYYWVCHMAPVFPSAEDKERWERTHDCAEVLNG